MIDRIREFIYLLFEKRPVILFEIVFWTLAVLLAYSVLAALLGWSPIFEISA